MKNLNILIVSRAFYPINAPRSLRATELAKEFARQGHKVTVLTPKKEIHNSFAEENNISIKDLGTPKWNSIEVKGSGPEKILRRAFRRFPMLWLEYPSVEFMWLVERALKKESGYDLMISIAVPFPIHWGVAKARSKNHRIAKTWVADCGDPYMGAVNDTFRKPFYFKYVEKWFCKKADFLTVPFEGSIAGYYPEFHHKIEVIPQGLSFPKLSSNRIKDNSTVKFAYAGNISSYKYHAIPFLQELNKIDQDFEFHIYTNNKSFYTNFLSKESLDKCYFREYLPRFQLLDQLTEMDFLVHFPYRNSTQRSLKLVDYMYLRKPILSYESGELGNKLFMEFLNKNYKGKMEEFSIDEYKIENVALKFIALWRKK